MTERFRFTKTRLAQLSLPEDGGRATYYDEDVPKLSLRVTSGGARSFWVVKRLPDTTAWYRLGAFPDMSVEQARNAANRVLGDFAKGINPAQIKREQKRAITVGEAYEQYRELHLAPRGVKSADDMHALWERCLGALPEAPPRKHGRRRSKHPSGVNWSGRKLEAITDADVRALHAAIGRTHKTMANRVVELLSAVYNHARKCGHQGANPAAGVEPFKEAKRDRFILPDELPRFFSALREDTSEDFQHFVLLSLLTGARRRNVLAMRWEELDLASATWRIPDTKNAEPQLVALVPEAVAILRKRKPQPSSFVFPAPSRSGHMTPPKKRWRGLLKRAAISDLRVHDLRRSLGSWQAISGASLAIIGKSLGHKSADATMIYARLHLDPVRDSVNKATSAMLEAAGVKRRGKVIGFRKGGARA